MVQRGQIKIIALIVDGGNSVVTPTAFTQGSTITLDDANDFIVLIYINSSWFQLAGNATVA